MAAVGQRAAPPPHGPTAGQSPSRGRQGLRGLAGRPLLGTVAALPWGPAPQAPRPLPPSLWPEAVCVAWKPTLHQGAPAAQFPPIHQPLRTHTGPPEALRLSSILRWAPNTHPLILPPWLLGIQKRRGSQPTLRVLSQSSLEAAALPRGVGVRRAAGLPLTLRGRQAARCVHSFPRGAAEGPASLTTSFSLSPWCVHSHSRPPPANHRAVRVSTCACSTQAGQASGAETEQKKEPAPQPGDWKSALGVGSWSPRPSAPPLAATPAGLAPRPMGAQTSYLHRERRRIRQEGRGTGKGAMLRGDAAIFLTMR